MSHHPLYEEISSAESCIDTAELEDLAKAAAAATGYVTPTHKSPSPIAPPQLADPDRPVGTVANDRRSYTIRVGGKDLCSIVSKTVEESQIYRLYWEANAKLVDAQRMKDAAEAESKAVVSLLETMTLRCKYLDERAHRTKFELQLQTLQMDHVTAEKEKIKKDFEEYKTASKTLIRHMQNQNKKSKKQSP